MPTSIWKMMPSSCATTQLEVETHFLTNSGINTTVTLYWMGIQQIGRTWFMLDGTVVGNGEPSNANPYAHW
jgi:hypothetical protein